MQTSNYRADHNKELSAFLLSFRQRVGLLNEDLSLLVETGTATKARESSDQDHQAFGTSLLGTTTLTESRESRDQDRTQMGYNIIPRR